MLPADWSAIPLPLTATAYNFPGMIPTARYALVAYLKNPVGEFVEDLRRRLHPEHSHLAAHLTVLPPRILSSTESAARETLEEICSQVEPFTVTLGEVETFCPLTATVFIRVASGAYRMRELHDMLHTGALASKEEWPYMPHLTIVKMGTEAQAQQAYQIASQRWHHFTGSRDIQVRELIFVREEEPNRWVDLAEVRLGRQLVTR
jgi:2'-5' RNA ligase